MSPFRRYVLIQIPGWILATLVLTALRTWLDYPLWVALLALGAWVAKDFALYPWLRGAYEESGPAGSSRLIGETAVAAETLDPRGYVHVRGELWQAEVEPGSSPVPAGTRVKVQAASGMKLTVKPE